MKKKFLLFEKREVSKNSEERKISGDLLKQKEVVVLMNWKIVKALKISLLK